MFTRQVLLLLLVTVTFVLKLVQAVGIAIPAHASDCYFEISKLVTIIRLLPSMLYKIQIENQTGNLSALRITKVEDEVTPNIDFWVIMSMNKKNQLVASKL
ncbi:unnamed protein product [Mucor hiemalis]